MLLEQGYKMTAIKGSQEGGVQLVYEEEFGESIIFRYNTKTLAISVTYVSVAEWLAINEKMKELGWLE